MDINWLGVKLIKSIVTCGLVSDVADIYDLKRNDLLKVEGFAEKKADNNLAAINESRNREINKLILALGIHGVGEVLANNLTHYYNDLDKFSNATISDLQKIEGICPNIARSIVDWFELQKPGYVAQLNRSKLHT